MKDQSRLVIVANGTPPGPKLNRAQRRQARRKARHGAVVGMRTIARPFHQSWTFIESSGEYIVTADATDVPAHPQRNVTFLCVDEDENVHGMWSLDQDRPQADCVHVALVANHVCESGTMPWRWGDDAA